jgi:WD40 repeat protein
MQDRSPDLRRAGDTLATTGDPLIVPDGAGGAGIPAAGPGALVRYRLGEEIARGGMGIVCRATDTVLGREVAVKILQGRYATDSGTALRFVAEARITGQLQHPGIPAIHDLGILPDGRPFLAMKLIKGETLDQLLRRRDHAAEGRGGVVAVFEQVCQAVAYAHAHGVLHRDLKPANIMVGAFGEVQVMDWGLAKVLVPGQAAADAAVGDPLVTLPYTEVRPLLGGDLLTHSGSVLGTPAYMPPEQAIGAIDQIDARSDVFGLGGVLAAVLTGHPPFVGDSAESSRQLAARGKLHDCFGRLDGSGADPELVALCKRCLSPEKADRPANAGEVAAAVAALRAAADERARRAELDRVRVEGEQAAAAARSLERRRRRRLLLGTAALLAVAAIGGLTAVLAVQRQANAAQRRANADIVAVNDTLRRANYVADMNLAQHAWEENNLVRTRQLLEEHRPKPGEEDLRGFEWHYLNRLFHRDQLTIHAHGGFAASVVFSPDGKRLFSCGKVRPLGGMQRSREVPSEIKLWDATSGRRLDLALDGSTDAVREIALSPDGTYLGAACIPGGIRVWNLATHQRFDLKTPTDRLTMTVGFSSDSKRLVASFASLDNLEHHEDVVRVYDLSTHDPVWTLEGLSYLARFDVAPAFSPDGKYLAIAHVLEGRVRVVEAATGHEAFSCKYGEATVMNANFSPDGKSLAIGSSLGLTIWDVATHQQRLTCQNTVPAGYYLAYSPDGKQLAMSGDGGLIGLWDARTGQQIGTFKGHVGSLYSITFRPDGRYLASAGSDGTVRLWDTMSRKDVIPLFKELKRPIPVDFSPDGQALLVLDSGASDLDHVFMVDATTGQRRGEAIHFDFRSRNSFDWAADGKQLLGPGDDKAIRIYATGTGAIVHSFPVDREAVCVVAISPDGRWFAHSAPAAMIKIRDAETGAERRAIRGLSDEVRNLAIAPDGSHLVGTDSKGWLRVWDVATGGECLSVQIQDMRFSRVRFSPDGKRLAIVGSNTRLTTGDVRILDAATGHEILHLAGHTSNIPDVTFSPDGQRVATASWDHTIRIWDAQTGQEILTLRGHTLTVDSVRFVSGGHRLLSASADRTIRVWDATPLPD